MSVFFHSAQKWSKMTLNIFAIFPFHYFAIILSFNLPFSMFIFQSLFESLCCIVYILTILSFLVCHSGQHMSYFFKIQLSICWWYHFKQCAKIVEVRNFFFCLDIFYNILSLDDLCTTREGTQGYKNFGTSVFVNCQTFYSYFRCHWLQFVEIS